MVLIIDTETTGLRGIPEDRVLEIGIAEYDGDSGNISPVYSEMICYDDIVDFDSKYVNIDGSRGIWIYRNSDMRLEDTLNAAKDLDTVVREVREIVSGKEVTSYNVPFDFGKFLYHEPWNLKELCSVPYDIMELATKRVYSLAEEDFKTAMIVLRNAWKYSCEETYAEAEELEEEEIDYEDDEYYAVVEYYDHEDGSSAEVYYADGDKKEISDIRFWMVIDEDERERFYSAYRELHPEWDPDEEDGILAAIMDPYKVYLYQKALNRV